TIWRRSLWYMSFLFCTSTIRGDAVVFDLGGVLVETRIMYSVKKLGIHRIIWYMISTRKGIGGLRETLYRLMDSAVKKEYRQHVLYKDEYGNELPLLMCNWLQGTMSARDIRAMLNKAVVENDTLFANATEKKLIQRMIRMIFTPHIFAKTREINDQMLSFVKECKKAGHKVFVLSNWDEESFNELKLRNTDLFDLFDGIMISGSESLAKPDQEFFQRFLERYELEPTQCWFIDDQYDNVKAARACGMQAIRYTKTVPLTKIVLKKQGDSVASAVA
ncbi:MAG TPA: HAD-IA family hydrolase, partial [Candidatus Bathyarchaeia archaeon]|nr:HAD-IA family hydrolase [Candidatus Bathyarchaeia archaeon]